MHLVEGLYNPKNQETQSLHLKEQDIEIEQ
jgi:hypothetical protein